MMYQSLYRVWRPRTFAEMAGQETVVRTLRNQAAQGRVAHAYLFCGSRGTGKTSAARIMASAINCENPDRGDPCLKCDSCRQLSGEATLDVYEMDAASNSRVEEIREMLEKVSYPPQFVRYKVYIIDEAHMLSGAAFNALLKTLEEPPAYMVFILATTEPQKIPATIHSRCQRFDFRRLSEEHIISRLRLALKEGAGAEEEALRLIAGYAEGSMRDAWSMMDVCLGIDGKLTEDAVRKTLGAVDKSFLFSYLEAVSGCDLPACLRLTDDMMRSGRDAQVFLRDLSAHVRQVISVGHGAQPQRDTTDENLARLRKQAQDHPLEELVHLLEHCARAETDLRWASSQRAALELFALRVCQAGGENSQSELLLRIARLEKNIAGLSGRAVPAPQESVPLPAPAPPPEKEKGAPRPAEDVVPAPLPEAPVPQPADVRNVPDIALRLPKDAWNAMLRRAEKELPSVYALLSAGKFGGFRDDAFKLVLPDGQAPLIDILLSDEKRRQIQGILGEEFGKPVSFRAVGEDLDEKEKERQTKAEREIHALSSVFGRENVVVKEREKQGPGRDAPGLEDR